MPLPDASASSSSPKPKIEYVIFDMDDNILARYGKEMTWEIKAGLMGKPERQAAEHLLSFFPGISLTIEEYLRERDAQQDIIWPHVRPLPGAARLVQHLHAHGIPIALATGSRRGKFQLKSANLPEIFGCFEGNIVCGDDGWFEKSRGKPCPDIFLVAAKEMLKRDVGTGEVQDAGVEDVKVRKKGLIFEDALPGVEAGKRAGMNVVWVPDANLLEVGSSAIHEADEVLRSLEKFDPAKWGLPPFKTDELK
ncbi:hypothetical protein EW145_g3582 [Phellinidium pouzarii]|uniref:HAD-like protein n=1 Tax=Phellinidium pouzarii TaxID=167371 RepID=A0A4S4L6V2_9AGAM|nr:hypothetical protein EW145_g3582 [Phellinidium pouzarii]